MGTPEWRGGAICIGAEEGRVVLRIEGPDITVGLDACEALHLAHALAQAVIDLGTQVPAGEGVH